MKFVNKTFTNEDVTMDANEFVDCTLDNCRITFYGGHFGISNSKFLPNCVYIVTGPAQNTLHFLRFLRLQNPEHIDTLLNAGDQPTLTPPPVVQ